jgi:hypothetical protein
MSRGEMGGDEVGVDGVKQSSLMEAQRSSPHGVFYFRRAGESIMN